MVLHCLNTPSISPPAPRPPLVPAPLPPPPVQVLLLDEITVDLDVLGRADLMRFLMEECTSRGATIIYATHIFDGLEFWPTHVAYVARGEHPGSGVCLGQGVAHAVQCSAVQCSAHIASGMTAGLLSCKGHRRW
jgi:energy-coupling factor transporter ATP-binding protein EcfA2